MNQACEVFGIDRVQVPGPYPQIRNEDEEAVGDSDERDERPALGHDIVRPEEGLVPPFAVRGDRGEVGEPLIGIRDDDKDVPDKVEDIDGWHDEKESRGLLPDRRRDGSCDTQHDRHGLDAGACEDDLDPEAVPPDEVPGKKGCGPADRADEEDHLAGYDPDEVVPEEGQVGEGGVDEEGHGRCPGEGEDARILPEKAAGRDEEEGQGKDREGGIEDVVLGEVVRDLGDEEEDHGRPSEDCSVLPPLPGKKKGEEEDAGGEDQVLDHSGIIGRCRKKRVPHQGFAPLVLPRADALRVPHRRIPAGPPR